MYKERYEEFQSTINKSNDMFQKFKTEMDKVSTKATSFFLLCFSNFSYLNFFAERFNVTFIFQIFLCMYCEEIFFLLTWPKGHLTSVNLLLWKHWANLNETWQWCSHVNILSVGLVLYQNWLLFIKNTNFWKTRKFYVFHWIEI